MNSSISNSGDQEKRSTFPRITSFFNCTLVNPANFNRNNAFSLHATAEKNKHFYLVYRLTHYLKA